MKILLTEKVLEIPKGSYCYSYYGGTFKLCPFFTKIKDSGVVVDYCNYLDEGCVSNDMPEEDYNKLINKYGSSKKLYEKYPLDLLWDLIKSCGENDEYY